MTSGDQTIVVDPWLAFDRDRSDLKAQADRADVLLGALAEAGAPAEDVDIVIDTHVDGVGWNVRPEPDGEPGRWVTAFPNARYCFSATELALSSNDSRLDPLRDTGAIETIDPPAVLTPASPSRREPGTGPATWPCASPAMAQRRPFPVTS